MAGREISSFLMVSAHPSGLTLAHENRPPTERNNTMATPLARRPEYGGRQAIPAAAGRAPWQ
jgi:hypothetical protein